MSEKMKNPYYHNRKEQMIYQPQFTYGKPIRQYPMIVTPNNRPIREVGVSLDPEYYLYLSDGTKYFNYINKYYEIQTPVIEENKHKLNRARKNRSYKQIAMRKSIKEIEERTRINFMNDFFGEIVNMLFETYDIIIIPNPFVYNTFDLFDYRGGEFYHGLTAMKRSHYDYFFRVLIGYAQASRLSNMLLLAPIEYVIGAYHTCSVCGTPRNDSVLELDQNHQWKCMNCGTYHQASLNEAKNLLKFRNVLLKKRMVYKY